MNVKNKLNYYLPSVRTLKSREEIAEIIRNNIRNNFVYETDIQISTIASLIYQKLVSKIPGISWDKEDYTKFKLSQIKLNDNNFDIVMPLYISILSSTNEEILNNLNYISENFEFYPTSTKKFNEETGVFETHFEQVAVLDCFDVIFILQRQMENFINVHAKKILSEEDFEISCSVVKEIYKSENLEEINRFLSNFDEKFSFLKTTTIYRELYELYRERYFVYLLSAMRKCQNVKLRQIELQKPTCKNHQAVVEYKKEKKAVYDHRRNEEGRR